eukprot:Gb_37829 [translate_table: standard]
MHSASFHRLKQHMKVITSLASYAYDISFDTCYLEVFIQQHGWDSQSRCYNGQDLFSLNLYFTHMRFPIVTVDAKGHSGPEATVSHLISLHTVPAQVVHESILGVKISNGSTSEKNDDSCAAFKYNVHAQHRSLPPYWMYRGTKSGFAMACRF